jgi:hypothetical protein
MQELNTSIHQEYDTIDDAELDDKICSMLAINSDLGLYTNTCSVC